VADAGQKKVHVFDRRNSRYYSFPRQPIEGLQSLVGVVASNDGRVYVSDSTTKLIHIFDDFGRVYSGSADISGLGRPTDLALRGGDKELIIVDTVNGEIVGLDTQDLSILWRVGRDGSTHDAFHFPTSVAVSENGSVYVSDSLNFRIQMLDPNLNFLGAFGQAGDSPGYFSRPKGVAVDSDGNIYVVDALFDNVQIFNTDGELLLNFGDSGQGPGEFWLPSDIYIDEFDRIYISDSHNSRVQIFQYIGEDEQS
jgi:DNA-binding beta-propeller fold protein YncE